MTSIDLNSMMKKYCRLCLSELLFDEVVRTSMKSRFHNYRAWTAAILLVAVVVPRCLMASDMVGMEKEVAQQPPCHGMQEQEITSEVFSVVTCAQQCEQVAVSSLAVKESDLKQWNHSSVAIVSTQTSVISSLIYTTLHQGWPPDNQFLLSSTPDLYLDTGRLRL